MTSSLRGIARTAVPLLALSLALGACGGGSSGTPTAATAASATATGKPPATTAPVVGSTSKPAGDAAALASAKALASILASGTGDAKSPTCAYFTKDEISDRLGATVGKGHDAALGLGCQWTDDSKDNVSALISVVPAEYYEEPSLADGYQEIKGIGTKGFVVPELGGFHAGALVGAKGINATLSGGKASKEAAVAFLRETIKRAG